MSKYRVSIFEEIGGFIELDAESKEKAKELAEELIGEYGVEKLFYPPRDAVLAGEEDLTQYNGKHTHRDAEVLTCEEIND